MPLALLIPYLNCLYILIVTIVTGRLWQPSRYKGSSWWTLGPQPFNKLEITGSSHLDLCLSKLVSDNKCSYDGKNGWIRRYCAISINLAGRGTGDKLAEILSLATSHGTEDRYPNLAKIKFGQQICWPNLQYFSVSHEFWSDLLRSTQNLIRTY